DEDNGKHNFRKGAHHREKDVGGGCNRAATLSRFCGCEKCEHYCAEHGNDGTKKRDRDGLNGEADKIFSRPVIQVGPVGANEALPHGAEHFSPRFTEAPEAHTSEGPHKQERDNNSEEDFTGATHGLLAAFPAAG